MKDVTIRDEAIRLGQLLKLAGATSAGSDAKRLIGEGRVSVNGEVEIRRGRQLRCGDIVALDGTEYRVV